MNTLPLTFRITTPVEPRGFTAPPRLPPSGPRPALPTLVIQPALPPAPQHALAPSQIPTRGVSIDRAFALLARMNSALRDPDTAQVLRACIKDIPPEDRVEVIDATTLLCTTRASSFELRILLNAVTRGPTGARAAMARATLRLSVHGRGVELGSIFTAMRRVPPTEFDAVVALTLRLRGQTPSSNDTSALLEALAGLPGGAREHAASCLEAIAPNRMGGFFMARLLNTLVKVPVQQHDAFVQGLRALRPHDWGHTTVDQAQALAGIPARLREGTVNAALLMNAKAVEGATLVLLASLPGRRRDTIARAFAAILPRDTGIEQESFVRALMAVHAQDLPNIVSLAGHIGQANAYERGEGVLALCRVPIQEREDLVLLLQHATHGIETSEQRTAVTRILSAMPHQRRRRHDERVSPSGRVARHGARAPRRAPERHATMRGQRGRSLARRSSRRA